MKNAYRVASLAMLAVAIGATALLYDGLPELVPVHWNGQGVADRWEPRGMLWAIGPGMMGVLVLLNWLLPKISPRRFEIDSFRPTYDYLFAAIVAFLGFVHALMLAAALGRGIPMERAVPAAMFVLLILLGNPMGKVQRNFFVGVRTPWTLASPKVWYATHRATARLMVASGVAGLVAVLAGAPQWLLLVIGAAWAVGALAFSLVLYKKLERTGQLDGWT